MHSPASILQEALKAPARSSAIASYSEAIRALRAKEWSWREIAAFLKERGVEVDHTKLLRFMQRLDKRWQIPTAEAYDGALQELRHAGKLSSSQWDMLMHLYRAHNRTATYTELAQAAGRGGAKVSEDRPHVYANREFGRLGRLLGEALSMEFKASSDREKPFYSSSIGVGSSATPEGAEFEIVMHHELAKALDRLLSEEGKGEEQ